jgi:hypothetical protein
MEDKGPGTASYPSQAGNKADCHQYVEETHDIQPCLLRGKFQTLVHITTTPAMAGAGV